MGLFFSPIKFTFYFAISFLILCFPIKGDKHVFDYLEKLARPITSKVYFFIDQKAKQGIEESKKIFTNSKPIIKDKINATYSSAAKRVKKEKIREAQDEENYTVEEKEAIRKILSNEY